MHLVTVNEDKLGRKVRTGGANLEVTTVTNCFTKYVVEKNGVDYLHPNNPKVRSFGV